MDIKKPVENPKLDEVIRKLTGGTATETDFFEQFAAAKFLCPADVRSDRPDSGSDGEISISFKTLEGNGSRYLMAFTNWAELYKWNSSYSGQTLVFGYKDYLSVLKQQSKIYAGMALNPFGANLVITAAMMENIEGTRTLPKGSQVLTGAPDQVPDQMIQELIRKFSVCENIENAFLLWMVSENEGSYLLVLDANLHSENLFAEIGAICRPYLNGIPLDIITSESPFAQNAVKGQTPFYIK